MRVDAKPCADAKEAIKNDLHARDRLHAAECIVKAPKWFCGEVK